MSDRYLTIERESKVETKVKGSRFIAETRRVDTREAVEGQLTAIRKREYAATHHCHAWRIGHGNDCVFKYSDDGEPNGTAGKPIYDVITGRDVTNVLLVVTRYFGGTKLGTGGLARAYSRAASEAMEQSGSRENFVSVQFRLEIAMSLYDRLQRLIHSLDAKVTESEFSDTAVVVVGIRESRAEEFCRRFSELSSGKGRLEQIEQT